MDGIRAVAAFRPEDVTVEMEGAPTKFVTGIAASTELFDVLGVKPRIGRGFHPGETRRVSSGSLC